MAYFFYPFYYSSRLQYIPSISQMQWYTFPTSNAYPNANLCLPNHHSKPISSSSLPSPPSSASLSLLATSLLLPNLLNPSKTPTIKPLPSATSIAPTPVILDTPPPSPSKPLILLLILLILTSLKSLSNPLTLSGSGTSSLAASSNISPSSNQ
jgi:hypothetical protein